jgi:hypothetical protein
MDSYTLGYIYIVTLEINKHLVILKIGKVNLLNLKLD